MEEPREPLERGEPQEIVRLHAYFEDCRNFDDAPLTVLASFVSLIKAEPAFQSVSYDRIVDAAYAYGIISPDYDQYAASPEITREHFALAPLQFLGPYVELAYEPDMIGKWYSVAVGDALAVVPEHANNTCIGNAQSVVEASCYQSELCPRRAAWLLLIEPARNYQFDAAEHVYNHELQEKIVTMKLDLAVKQGLITKDLAIILKDQRKLMYERYNNLKESE